MKILFFGDVIGALGRQGLVKILPNLKTRFSPDLIVANVENLAHGAGVTEKTLLELSNAGIQIFTGGNHSWGNPIGLTLFENSAWENRLVVPTNFGGAKNGKNFTLITVNETQVLIANVMGQLFTHPETKSPFKAFDEIVKTAGQNLPNIVIVDFHGEATSEKEAFGHYVDGKVSGVFGTHTHVPTADAKILPGGTAYLTDVGRCGAYDSVNGFEKNSSVKRFLNLMEDKSELLKTGPCEINGVLLNVDDQTGRAITLDQIREIVDV